MKINWRLKFRYKPYLLALFSLLLMLAQQISAIFGYHLTSMMSDQLTNIFNTILAILVLLGFVIDPVNPDEGTEEDSKDNKK